MTKGLPSQATTPAVPGIRRWIGILGLSLLALGIGPSTAAISLAYGLLFLFALSSWREITVLWHAGWASKALLLLTLYVIIQGVTMGLVQDRPAFSGDDLQHVVRTVSLGTVLAGWAVYACRMSPRILGSLFVAGLAIATVEAFLEHGWELFSMRRMHYLRSPNEVGLFGGTIFLVGLFIAGSASLRCWHHRRQPAIAAALGLLAFVLVISGLWLWLQSGSRSTWVGLTVALGLITAAGALMVVRQRRGMMSFAVGTAIVATIVAGLGTFYADDIRPRIERELPSIAAIAEGDTESLMAGRDAGHNARFKIWAVAINEIGERPLTGWGSGSVTSHFNIAVDDGKLRDGRDHYHNLYLHLAVFIGMPFVALGLAAYGSVFRQAAASLIRESGGRADVGWFIAAWGLFFAVSSLFQVRMHSAYGAAFFILFTGMAYGLYLHTRLPEQRRATESETETA